LNDAALYLLGHIHSTRCYNFHHYAAHTCRRLTLFCAGTTNSLLCSPATTWPPRQLLALLPHVSMFLLNNPYLAYLAIVTQQRVYMLQYYANKLDYFIFMAGHCHLISTEFFIACGY
jgi:hypothetical protein